MAAFRRFVEVNKLIERHALAPHLDTRPRPCGVMNAAQITEFVDGSTAIDNDRIMPRLRDKVMQLNKIIRYVDDPAMTSLCTVIGLRFELGNPVFDRLSPHLGVELPADDENPYWVEVRQHPQLGFGLCVQQLDGAEFTPRTEALAVLLHESSFAADGLLRQIVIYPAQVAQRLQRQGFQLVIVRDWLLRTALAVTESAPLNYLIANEWELSSVIAQTQAKLMLHSQLPFFGTHDKVDHIFGAEFSGYQLSHSLVSRCAETFASVFASGASTARSQQLIAYMIGVFLDDLAQPKWYGSQSHCEAIEALLVDLQAQSWPSWQPTELAPNPQTLAAIIATVRAE